MSENGPIDPEPLNLHKGLEKQGKQCVTSGLTVGSDEEELCKTWQVLPRAKKGKAKGLDILHQMIHSQRVNRHVFICMYVSIRTSLYVYNAHRYSFSR